MIKRIRPTKRLLTTYLWEALNAIDRLLNAGWDTSVGTCNSIPLRALSANMLRAVVVSEPSTRPNVKLQFPELYEEVCGDEDRLIQKEKNEQEARAIQGATNQND
jgi:hypothetical protein